MIKQKKKRCKDCGRMTYLWSSGRCRQCDAVYRSVYKRKNMRSSQTPIRPRSLKRQEQEKKYKKICKDMDKNKPHICFFCDLEIAGRPDHHHLRGRVALSLMEERYIVKAHRKCHRDYHDQPVGSQTWYDGFMSRLKRVDFDLYRKELMKLGK